MSVKRIFPLCLIALGSLFAQEKAPQSIIDLANSKLVLLGKDPVIVQAVKAANAEGKTLDQIKTRDETWKSTPGVDDFMKGLLDSECGKHLVEIRNSKPYYAEIFVTDNQGANVAMSDKTSDYWQGDEDKFTETYKDGQGAVYISDVEFDDSSQTYVVQVSVPVRDGSKTIGTLTVSIDMDAFE